MYVSVLSLKKIGKSSLFMQTTSRETSHFRIGAKDETRQDLHAYGR